MIAALLCLLAAAIDCVRTVPAYVVNLADRHERRRRFLERFDALGAAPTAVTLRVLAATDSDTAAALLANGTLALKPDFVDPFHRRVMKLGEVGCAHSHFRAWQAIAAQNDSDWAIVFEDDVRFLPPFAARFADWRDVAPALDVFFYARKKLDTAATPAVLAPGIEAFVHSYWTIAYALTKAAAAALADERFLKQIVPVDEYVPSMLLDANCATSGVCGRPRLRGAAFVDDVAAPAGDADVPSDTEVSRAAPQSKSFPFQLVTFASDERYAGYRQLLRSAQHFGLSLVNLAARDGERHGWRGGDVAKTLGGGQKFCAMKRFVAAAADKAQRLLFVDGYDALVIADGDKIAAAIDWLALDDDAVLFGAERTCWPDAGAADRFPAAPDGGTFRYLNSGLYLGTVGAIELLLADWNDTADEQRDDQAYAGAYLLAHPERARLDYANRLFFNLGETTEGVDWRISEPRRRFETPLVAHIPCFLHGNGPAGKHAVQQIGNYEAGAWSPFYGSMWQPRAWAEESDAVVLGQHRVVLALLCRATPFADQFDAAFSQLALDRERTHLFFFREQGCLFDLGAERRAEFASVARSTVGDVSAAKAQAIQIAVAARADAVLFLDTSVFVRETSMLADLLRANLTLVAPHAQRPGEKNFYSNYWTAATTTGWFASSFNTAALYERRERGLWAVPFVMNVWLLRRAAFADVEAAAAACSGVALDPDVCLCNGLRAAGVPMFVDNRRDFAEMLETDERAYKDDEHTVDLYEAERNPHAWDRSYLDAAFAAGNATTSEPCPDVYAVKVFNERFARELVAEAERFGKWSSGKNEDARIVGGYENVPTQDIHTWQIGWQLSWVAVLKRHLYPLFLRLYDGSHFKREINIAFVVRYITSGQAGLRAHQDASAVTTVTTLSDDFDGGGARFTRYNCSHVSKELGLVTIHPGRITHTHEGLSITRGRRYILVSFNE